MQFSKLFVVLMTLVFVTSGCVSKKKLNEATTALEAQKELLSKCEERSADHRVFNRWEIHSKHAIESGKPTFEFGK